MVKKSSKLGVHSGNSLRASNSKYVRVYAKQACLVRNFHQEIPFNVIGTDETDDADIDHTPVKTESVRDYFDLQKVVSDWDVSGNNVSFSLNKKGRWLLPALIKDQIHSYEQGQEDYKISLFEHHKILKKANCVSYHTSKGAKKVITTKTGFFNKSSVDKPPGTGSRRRKRKPRPAQFNPLKEDFEEIVKDPEIIYDVFYPSPITSSLTHNPKFIGSSGDSKCHGKANMSAIRRVHKTTSEYLDIFDEETNGDQYDEDLLDAENVTENIDSSTEITLERDNLLEVLLEKAIIAKEMCDIERSYVITDCKFRNVPSSEQDTKDNVIYVNKDLPLEFYPNHKNLNATEMVLALPGNAKEEKMAENITRERFPSARIFIPADELGKDNLERNFSGRYFEGNCHPRKIAIDISQEISAVLRQRGLLLGHQEAWSWLTLSQDGDQHEGLEVIRVCLNSELVFNQTSLETLFEMNVYSLEEVCQSVQMFIESLSFDNTDTLHNVFYGKSMNPNLTFDTLRSQKKWSCDSYHSSQSHKMALMTKNCSEDEAIQMNNMPEFCNICFTTIDPSIHDNAPATCLRSCGHWFCDDCWASHLISKLNTGSLKLKCPEFDCDLEIDHVTCLTLMPASKFKKFLQHCHDNKVQQKSEEQKWCPNPKCGRVVRLQSGVVDEDAGVCITCDCGHCFCFNCVGEAHWPATCQQANNHRLRMKQYGDERIIDFSNLVMDYVVKVKNCPRCKEPISKNGGCPHVTCRCNHAFCWACGSDWPHKNACRNDGASDKQGTTKRVIRHEDTMKCRPKLYQLSVKHRQYRHPRKIKEFKRKSEKFAIFIKPWAVRHFKEVESILGKYGAVENDRFTIIRAVEQFVHKIAKLMIEIHFVIEYSALVLQDVVASNYSRLVHQLIERMEFMCGLITQIYEGNTSREKKAFIPDLQRIQSHMRNCLINLIKAVTEIGSTKNS